MKGAQTRNQFIDTAVKLFQRDGFHGVGLARLIEESGAPKGSFYFHFKGGKEDLALETIARSRERLLGLFGDAFDRSKDRNQYVGKIGKGIVRWLQETDFNEGCPVASMTLEVSASSPRIAEACRDAYAVWTSTIEAHLDAFTSSNRGNRAAAYVVMSAFEGAVVICRSQRSAAPLKHVIGYLKEI